RDWSVTGVQTCALPIFNSWNITFQKQVIGTGEGEPVADQATFGFRIFNVDPTNPVSTTGWTPLGPAAIGGSSQSGGGSSEGGSEIRRASGRARGVDAEG